MKLGQRKERGAIKDFLFLTRSLPQIDQLILLGMLVLTSLVW